MPDCCEIDNGEWTLGTVMHHLAHIGIAHRHTIRKMSDESVAVAAAQYEAGASLAVVSSEFHVPERTLASEFR